MAVPVVVGTGERKRINPARTVASRLVLLDMIPTTRSDLVVSLRAKCDAHLTLRSDDKRFSVPLPVARTHFHSRDRDGANLAARRVKRFGYI